MKLPECTPYFLPLISAGVGGGGFVATIFLANKFAVSEYTAAIGVILSMGVGLGVTLIIAYCYLKQYRISLL